MGHNFGMDKLLDIHNNDTHHSGSTAGGVRHRVGYSAIKWKKAAILKTIRQKNKKDRWPFAKKYNSMMLSKEKLMKHRKPDKSLFSRAGGPNNAGHLANQEYLKTQRWRAWGFRDEVFRELAALDGLPDRFYRNTHLHTVN